MEATTFITEIPRQPVQIRRVAVAEIVDLRHRILRAGLPRQEAIFPGDEEAATLHFGAFVLDVESPRNIACATFHQNEFEGRPAWQLRGMACEPEFRGQGVGAALLRYSEQFLPPILQLWCNARTPAIGFYEKQGWQCISEIFDIPTAGPHRRMSKLLK